MVKYHGVNTTYVYNARYPTRNIFNYTAIKDDYLNPRISNKRKKPYWSETPYKYFMLYKDFKTKKHPEMITHPSNYFQVLRKSIFNYWMRKQIYKVAENLKNPKLYILK